MTDDTSRNVRGRNGCSAVKDALADSLTVDGKSNCLSYLRIRIGLAVYVQAVASGRLEAMHLIFQIRIARVYRVDGRANIYIVYIALLILKNLSVNILDELVVQTGQRYCAAMVIIETGKGCANTGLIAVKLECAGTDQGGHTPVVASCLTCLLRIDCAVCGRQNGKERCVRFL